MYIIDFFRLGEALYGKFAISLQGVQCTLYTVQCNLQFKIGSLSGLFTASKEGSEEEGPAAREDILLAEPEQFLVLQCSRVEPTYITAITAAEVEYWITKIE